MENKEQLKSIASSPSSMLSGSTFIAQTFKGYGVTHVFFVEAIMRGTLVEMEKLGIRRILAHSEKAAAYMRMVMPVSVIGRAYVWLSLWEQRIWHQGFKIPSWDIHQ